MCTNESIISCDTCGTYPRVQETEKLTACLYVLANDSNSQCWLESRYNECSCVVADLYCLSRLSCVVAAPQDCVEVVQALWLCGGCPGF